MWRMEIEHSIERNRCVDHNEWAWNWKVCALKITLLDAMLNAWQPTVTENKAARYTHGSELTNRRAGFKWFRHFIDVKLLINRFVNIPAIKCMNNVIEIVFSGTLEMRNYSPTAFNCTGVHAKAMPSISLRHGETYEIYIYIAYLNYSSELSRRIESSNIHTNYPTCMDTFYTRVIFFAFSLVCLLAECVACVCMSLMRWFSAAMSLHVFDSVNTFPTASWISWNLLAWLLIAFTFTFIVKSS